MPTPNRLRASETRAAAGGPQSSELGEYGILLNGQWPKMDAAIEVHSPYDDALVAVVHLAGPKEIEAAIAVSAKAFEATRKIPSWEREKILNAISEEIQARHEEFARTIALEAGKPIRTARAEVDRAVYTFRIAAEETKRIYGEIVPLDWLPGNEGRMAHVRRVPLGPVVGISPFNFPLNLVAHKVAPALAAGNPIIIRPSSATPVSALKLGEVILEAGWPAGGCHVLPCSTEDAAPLVEDDRVRKLSFTGSPAVGWMLKRNAGMKRVTLELGGNAGVIVHSDADVAHAASRVAWGGFSYAGQSCISVQRVYAAEPIYKDFVDELIPLVESIVVGDPLDEKTDVGPLIDGSAAERVEAWIKEAVDGGARLLTGGQRDGNLVQPTVLENLDPTMSVSCKEVFGPVVGVDPYAAFEQAVQAVDDSEFGLQAGVFTSDWDLIQYAFDNIEVGGLMVNEVSTFRIDHMPYGGVKQSGLGREGLRYAIEEMTEMKLLTYKRRDIR